MFDLLRFALQVLIFSVASLFVIYLTIRFIVAAISKVQKTKPVDFDVLLGILYSMIEAELQAYEMEIFNNRSGISNSNYANFFEDICETINNHISEDFLIMMDHYISRDFTYTLIARKVKSYLNSKVI